MKPFVALVAFAGLAFASAAYAQASCTAPTAPPMPNGASATLDEMMAANAATKKFIADSDTFQQCEVDSVAAQRTAAKEAKRPFDASVAKASEARVSANQKQKEAAGGAYSSAVKAYKAAHPS